MKSQAERKRSDTNIRKKKVCIIGNLFLSRISWINYVLFLTVQWITRSPMSEAWATKSEKRVQC